MTFDDRLRDDLRSLDGSADLLPPPNLADLALAGARRQTYRRAALSAGAALVAVGSVGATMPLWLTGGGGAPEPGTLSCDVGQPLDPFPPSLSWDYFDPLRYEIDTSAVAGFEPSSASTSRYVQMARLTNPARDRSITVTLYARGGEPHYRTDDALPFVIDPSTGPAADPVGGLPAYWLPEQTYVGLPQEQGLAWQWVSGAWVFVTAAASDAGAAIPESSTVDHAELRELAASVAPYLAFGGSRPMTAPFSMPVPACTRVSGVHLMDDGPYTRFGLVFGPDDYADPTNYLSLPGSGGQAITVAGAAHGTPSDKPGSVNSTVDGHPAADIGGFLTVYDVDGLAFELTAPPSVDKVSLFGTISVYPGANDDRSAWGSPVR